MLRNASHCGIFSKHKFEAWRGTQPSLVRFIGGLSNVDHRAQKKMAVINGPSKNAGQKPPPVPRGIGE
jgi:hypothetical protein